MNSIIRFLKSVFESIISMFDNSPIYSPVEATVSSDNINRRVSSEIYRPFVEDNKKTEVTTPANEVMPVAKQVANKIMSKMNYSQLIDRLYRVKYDVSYHKLDYASYPTVLIPQKGTIIKPPQFGRNANIGASESMFLKYLKRYFDKVFNVSAEMSLFTKGKSLPYEPDFTLWNVFDDNFICLDIEIDEPYVGGTGEPTHCKGYDIERNKDFLNRGWAVIRFSENQIVENPDKCCKTIATVLSDLVKEYKLPKSLANIKPLRKEKYWDESESKKLASDKVRERLLNREFFINQDREDDRNNSFDEFLSIEAQVEDKYAEYDYLKKKKPNNKSAGQNKSYKNDIISFRVQNDNKKKTKAVIQNFNEKTAAEKQKTEILSEKATNNLNGISNTVNNFANKSHGFDRNGNVSNSTAAIVPKPTRHYGGKFDKRIYELMRPKKNSFSLALMQKIFIESSFDFLNCTILNGTLICKGSVKPEFCNEYEMRIEYKDAFVPKVFISNPVIKPDNKIHMYPDGSLCLYYPNDFKWQDNYSIAEYFIPWALEWIYCYEYYQATGKWIHEEAPGHEIIELDSKILNN